MEHKRAADPEFASNDFVPQWMKKEQGQNGSRIKGFEQGAGVEPRVTKGKKQEERVVREPKPGSYQQRVNRQRSLDQPDGPARNPSSRYRHYSSEEDYYHYGTPYFGHDTGFPAYSAPSPPTYPFRMVNGGGGGYMYSGEAYYYNSPPGGAMYRGGRGRMRQRSGGERREERPEGKAHARTAPVDFNTEFPSLNGDYAESSGRSTGSQSGSSGGSSSTTTAWADGNSGANVVTSKARAEEKEDKQTVFKALIPAKVSIARRGQDLAKSSAGKEGGRGGTGREKAGNSLQQKPAPIQILSASVKMTTPKKLGNKNKFLRALKVENKTTGGEVTQNGAEKEAEVLEGSEPVSVGNGKLSAEEELLSASMEKEQRLLREMGWHESDDEEYEITEDDKRLFQQQLQQKQRSGSEDLKLRNGLNGMHRLLSALSNGNDAGDQ